MAARLDLLNVFAGNPLDRAGVRRRDSAWLEERLRDPASRYLAVWKLQVLVRSGGEDEPGLAWARGEIRDAMDPEVGVVLLGLHDGVAHFAVDVSSVEDPGEALGLGGAAGFIDVRTAAAQLPGTEAAIIAQARALIDWHARHRFCAACGEPTRTGEAGYLRACSAEGCGAQHFPRTDPVVITLAERGDRCLLGRQSGWPAGFYSALAGFVEPGETIEEAARREVLEEAGIRLGAVRYHSSQPWPFPASLMIGCLAEAESEEIRLDDEELEEARWFERERVREALESEGKSFPRVPPPLAIAHQLMRAWVST
jgi:NAD+ diphosphatase